VPESDATAAAIGRPGVRGGSGGEHEGYQEIADGYRRDRGEVRCGGGCGVEAEPWIRCFETAPPRPRFLTSGRKRSRRSSRSVGAAHKESK
jgi:hypothetical protein